MMDSWWVVTQKLSTFSMENSNIELNKFLFSSSSALPMKAATSVWSCMESVNARSRSNISTYLYICIIFFLSAPTPLLFYQKQKPLCSVETSQGWAQFRLNQTLATSFCFLLFSGRGSAICTTSESSIVAQVWSFFKASCYQMEKRIIVQFLNPCTSLIVHSRL